MINTPLLNNINYVLGGDVTQPTLFTFPDFVSNLAECPLTYTMTSTPQNTFIEFLAPNEISWSKVTELDIGLYSVTVTATNENGVSASATFILTIEKAQV